MRNRKTSRVLNDEAYFLGLSYNDITGTGVFLLMLIIIGKIVGLESMLWALILSIGLLFVLIPIRLKYRRKILRDSLKYALMKGVINVSKNHRN